MTKTENGVNVQLNNQNNLEVNETNRVLLENKDHMFFTHDEMRIFLKEYDTIILRMSSGMPYINYEVAKRIFESVVGNNYSLEILSYEYLHEFETFMAHVRITLVRGDKKISKDVIGCETATRSKMTNEITNFHNMPKSAVKDALKKFLSDYIGIGSIQYMRAKKEYEDKEKQKYNKNSNTSSNPNDNQAYFCSDCNASITPKIYTYSVNYHTEKRPLCPMCQKKY